MSVSVSLIADKTFGYVGITTFKFKAIVNPITQLDRVVWYFGDNETSFSLSPEHIYKTPGRFNVKLVVYSKDKKSYQVTKIINTEFLLNESIFFERVPPPTLAGFYNKYPFKIKITSAQVGDHYIDLSAQFSRSSPFLETNNKWSFLKPRWRFFDLNGNVISRIKTTDTLLKANEEGIITPDGTFVAGVSGYAEFYFTDDIYNFDLAASNQPYTTLIATLETSGVDVLSQTDRYGNHLPGFANSLAQTTCPYIILWKTPDELVITENGINPHANPRWSTSKIPLIVYSTSSSLEQYNSIWNEGNKLTKIDNPVYFSHNFPLNNEDKIPVNIGLDSLSSSLNIEPFFQWTDRAGFKSPGYYKGLLDVPDVNAFSVAITAQANISIPALSSNYINPFLWISNPNDGSIIISQYTHQQNLSNSYSPNLNIAHNYNFNLAEIHGIYSIAATSFPDYQAWMLDSDSQYLYRASSLGNILCAVDLNLMADLYGINYLIPNTISPATMCIDGLENIWITLYDCGYILKLDKYAKFVSIINPTASSSLPLPSNLPLSGEVLSSYDQNSYYPSNSNFDDINLYEPTFIDSDISNNVYVSYSNPFSGFLVKYNNDGEIVYKISAPSGKIPKEIVCDKNNNFWVVLQSPTDNSFYIEKRNYQGSLLSKPGGETTFGPFENVGNITIDINQHLWFTHEYRSVGKINTSTYAISTKDLTISSSFPITEEDTALEGISADLSGKVYVINSVENRVYVLDTNSFELENYYFVNPQGLVHYLDNNDQPKTVYGYGNKSAQAQGDWSGFRWINKYGSASGLEYSTSSSVISLSGSSPRLDFYKDRKFAYDIFKYNESYDLAKKTKELAFQPSLRDAEVLFDKFLPSILGKEPFEHDDLGLETYEKIANFVSNQSDIDTCGINQLYSLAEMVDLDTDDFKLNYPPAISKLMDLASINQSRLWGTRDFNLFNFQLNERGAANRGNVISSLSHIISAGEPVVLRTKALNSYQLIYTGRVSNRRFYTLADLAQFLNLPEQWQAVYEFYEFKNSISDEYLDGVIDLNNPNTTILTSKSTNYFSSLKNNSDYSPNILTVSDENGNYPGRTLFDLHPNQEYLTITSIGEPYPAKAGVSSFVNDGITVRTGYELERNIEKQKYSFTFTYRAGRDNSLARENNKPNSPLGMTLNGIPIYSFFHASKTLPGSSISAAAGFNWNMVGLPSYFKSDLAGGYISADGKYNYKNGKFIKNGWTDYIFWSKNKYLFSSYNGDHFRHPNGHSKIIGFSFDGYPIYGPFAYANGFNINSEIIRMTSSFFTRTSEAYQRGFSYNEFSAGSFVEDYVFQNGYGTLDEYNGRFAQTPEYPQGTYAYFLTFSDDNLTTPAFPYIFSRQTKQRKITASYFNKAPFTASEWEGDNGILEALFGYELYRGLNLLK